MFYPSQSVEMLCLHTSSAGQDMFTRIGLVKLVRQKGPSQFVGMEGGDWLACKGLGLYFKKRYQYHFFPSNFKISSPHLLAFEIQPISKTIERMNERVYKTQV